LVQRLPLGESSDGEQSAAQDQAVRAAEAAVEHRVKTDERKLQFLGKLVRGELAEVIVVDLQAAIVSCVFRGRETAGVLVIATEAFSAFGDTPAGTAVRIGVLAFLEHGFLARLNGCWLLVVSCQFSVLSSQFSVLSRLLLRPGDAVNEKAQPRG